MTHRRVLSSVAASALLVACGAGGSDASFWEPSQDVGGTQHDFAAAGPGAGGGAGQASTLPPPPGAGGNYVTPPGSGSVPGAGGYVPTESGGASFGGTDPGAGGATVITPPPGAGGSVVVAGPPPAPGNSGPCTFTFNATTSTANGQFAPRNVGALWIEDASGKFVKSLEVWGAQRLGNLTAWETNSGGNTTDAITSATHNNHGPHSDHWDCTDTSRAPVVNGAYQACVSFAEDDAFPFFGPAPHLACTPFNKGAGPFTLNPPDQANFKSMQLVMQ